MSFCNEAQWISGPAYDYGTDDAGYYQNHPNHVLVRSFDAGQHESALLHVAVLGYARVLLNGVPVSDAELLGDWTNPTKVVYYDTFDVAGLLCEGENELVVELGNGKIVTACVYPAEDGMEVYTNTPKVMESRKTTIQPTPPRSPNRNSISYSNRGEMETSS